jgi:hypothetical protein
MSKHTLAAWLLAALSAAATLWAQPEPDPLKAVAGDYDQGRYQQAADGATAALADTANLDRETVSFLRTYRAFSLVVLGREGEAEEEFLRLLAMQPKLELNPEFVSPKIIEVFKRARSRFRSQAPVRTPEPAPLFTRPKPSKAQALWRSLLWPGWGQRHRGGRLKANILQGASLGAIGAWGALELGTGRARDEYLAGTDPALIQADYNTYNSWYRARNLAVNCVAAVWLYNVVDVLMTE